MRDKPARSDLKRSGFKFSQTQDKEKTSDAQDVKGF